MPRRLLLFAVLCAFIAGISVVFAAGGEYFDDRAAPDFDKGLSDAERDAKYRELTSRTAGETEALLQRFIASGASVSSLAHRPINGWVDSSSVTLGQLSKDAPIIVRGHVIAQWLEDGDASTFGTTVVSRIAVSDVLKGDVANGGNVELEQSGMPMSTADGSFVLRVDPSDPVIYLDHDVVLFAMSGTNDRLRAFPLSILTIEDGLVSVADGALGLAPLNERTEDQALSILRACLDGVSGATC